MGLDFGIYYKKKSEEMPKEGDWSKWMDSHELCYGRKAWELVHFLNLPINSKDDPLVDKKDWDNLISTIKSFLKNKGGNYFDELREDYNLMDKYEEHDRDIPPEILDNVMKYEVWYDNTFDETPTLGYDFALGYLRDFYEANEEVTKYLNDTEYEVRAYISY